MSSSYNRTGWREPPAQRRLIQPADPIAARHDRLTARLCYALAAFALLYFVGQMLRAVLS
ncbi:hypothetical protein [Sphingomonas sanxanigenens]|uniref:Uncharacterized protein n=1 Tax=Sphingomonas sanxanigenens DSM 19645 = NX02 TaxID=1123269 RepID=W0AAC4_9SPHN|nr:hypothetical protein [Sphingomonas sanxanigenens]AHE52605.1 hypothetical protein NX02_04285 [Sphingomonas sanxanigenens DSM 19645 = NX02]